MEYTPTWARFELTTLVVIGTDCTGSCKSNYHAITTTMAPTYIKVYVCLTSIKDEEIIHAWILIP
jgi:hypothetical protein